MSILFVPSVVVPVGFPRKVMNTRRISPIRSVPTAGKARVIMMTEPENDSTININKESGGGLTLDSITESKMASAIIEEIRNIPSRPVFYSFLTVGVVSAFVLLSISSSVLSTLNHLPVVPDIFRLVSWNATD